MSDVIKFPKVTGFSNPQETLDGINQKIVEAKTQYIDTLVDHHGGQLLHAIAMSGFDVEDDVLMKDFTFTVETLRSLMMRSMGMEHPLHEIVEQTVTLADKDDIDGDEWDEEE